MTRSGLLVAALIVALAAPASARPAAQASAALQHLQPGLWRLQLDEGESRTMCVVDANALVQLKHGTAAACSRLVIADETNSTTVHYSCPGAGWGRTSIRVVTDSLVHLDTQGMRGGLPFAFAGEGRRIGACALAARR